jgi:hypothetical protein
MQIQINSDKNIVVNAETAKLIEADLHRLLDRFESEVTRVEVHLSDENAGKSGPRGTNAACWRRDRRAVRRLR